MADPVRRLDEREPAARPALQPERLPVLLRPGQHPLRTTSLVRPLPEVHTQLGDPGVGIRPAQDQRLTLHRPLGVQPVFHHRPEQHVGEQAASDDEIVPVPDDPSGNRAAFMIHQLQARTVPRRLDPEFLGLDTGHRRPEPHPQRASGAVLQEGLGNGSPGRFGLPEGELVPSRRIDAERLGTPGRAPEQNLAPAVLDHQAAVRLPGRRQTASRHNVAVDVETPAVEGAVITRRAVAVVDVGVADKPPLAVP